MSCRFLPAAVVGIFASSLSFAHAAGNLPASYSLADAGYMIPVKNQGALGVCWSFSSTTVFETNLVRQGLMSIPSASNYISEWDMATHDGVTLSLSYPYQGWGAFPYQAISYLTRGFGRWKVGHLSQLAGGGPIAQAGDPLNVYPLAASNQGLYLGPYVPPPNQPLVPYRLSQALEFVDKDTKNGEAPSAAFRDKLKRAILKYGALDTNINATYLTGSQNTFNSYYDTYAYTGKSGIITHDVTVIGWNDAVPVYNAAGQLLGTGAWLIQNSWGVDFARSKHAVPKPDGCFWLGYVDTIALKYCCTMIPEKRGGISSDVLQNQIFYFNGTQTAGFRKGIQTMAAEKLTAQNDTKLLAIGLWTVADSTALDIDVFTAWGPNGPAGLPIGSAHDVMVPTRGYSEIPLAAPLLLRAGQPVYVVVNFGSAVDYPIALDHMSLSVNSLGSFQNLSWLSTDGKVWTDLIGDKAGNGIFIMKGIQGHGRMPRQGAFLSVTGLKSPLETTGSSFQLRGTTSFNTDQVLWRLGKGKVHVARENNSAWKITVQGLQPGRNVVSIWPTTETGVATSPTKVSINRR